MSTFADIAILLMAFFVLILSFAEFNQPKFKLVSGSLKQAFGVQRQVPVMEQQKGTTVLKLNFSPSPDISVTDEIVLDTTDTTQPEILSQSEEEEDGTGKAGDGEKSEAADAQPEDAARQDALEALAEALMEALGQSDIDVEERAGAVVVDLEGTDAEALPERIEQVAEALQEAGAATGQATDDVLIEGLTDQLLDRPGSPGPGR